MRVRISQIIPVPLFLTAFSVRLYSLLHFGGMLSVLGYDDGVYYSAANGLIHGQLPYRDYILVHPPGILILLSPFALLGRIVGDSTGLIAARLAFMILGSITTVFIYLIARKLSLYAGLVAGFTYALWYPAIIVERTSYLEAIGLFSIAVALFMIQKSDFSRRNYIVAGALLGLSTATKLWFAIPVIVIGVWLLIQRRIKEAIIIYFTSFVTFLTVVSFFWIKAGSKFIHLILFAQLNRSSATSNLASRISRIFNLETFSTSIFTSNDKYLIFASIFICIILLARIILEHRIVSLWLLLFLAQIAILLKTPTFFQAYPSYIAPTFALLIGALTFLIQKFFHGFRAARGVVSVAITISIFSFCWHGIYLANRGEITPINFLRDVTTSQRCVAADSPIILAISNSLTSDFANKCQVIFDVNGTIYGVEEPAGSKLLTATERRKRSLQYQNDLIRYFEKSDIFILNRISADGLAKKSLIQIERKKFIEQRNGFVAYIQKSSEKWNKSGPALSK